MLDSVEPCQPLMATCSAFCLVYSVMFVISLVVSSSGLERRVEGRFARIFVGEDVRSVG